MSVFEGPLNWVGDGPVVQGVGVDKMEVGIGGRGEEDAGDDQRPSDGGSGFKEFSSIGHGCSLGKCPIERRNWGTVGSLFLPCSLLHFPDA